MLRTKTLTLSLVSALVAASALPALAQIDFRLSSDLTYRQIKNKQKFFGGSFIQDFMDGSSYRVSGCTFVSYVPPGANLGACAAGTTGLVRAGNTDSRPYVTVSNVFPAVAVAPQNADKVFLNAAPASTMPRPAGGFQDRSYSLFYDLTTTNIREYTLTNYFKRTNFTKKQESKFDSQVVPGAYYYSFPSLRDPLRSAPVSAVIYPMIEGRQKKNGVKSGFEFSKVNRNKLNSKGFVELSYMRPNKFEWIGVNPSNVIAGVDTGYFSIKVLKDPSNANSAVLETYRGQPVSVFPPYQNGGDPRVRFLAPYTSSFIAPPIFDSGTRGVAQVQYQRQLKTGGVSYDYSSRQFQIPIVVVDSYSDYEDIIFKKPSKKTALLLDTDGDGYNNLTEWILESDASDSGSIPTAPDPELVVPDDENNFIFSYFGFDVKEKIGTDPAVDYTLQVSRDNGKTWSTFVSNINWSVQRVGQAATGALPASITIQVRSLFRDAEFIPAQPPGTARDLYRVKITLKTVKPLPAAKAKPTVKAKAKATAKAKAQAKATAKAQAKAKAKNKKKK